MTEILHWIKNRPILQPPTVTHLDSISDLPISVPPQATAMLPHNIPAAITQRYETTQQEMSYDMEIPTGLTISQVPDANEILAQIANEECIPIADTHTSNNSPIAVTRTSTRTKMKRDFLQPKFHGKVYNVRNKSTSTSGKQREFTNDKTKSNDLDLHGDWYLRRMPTSTLPPAFRQGPWTWIATALKQTTKITHWTLEDSLGTSGCWRNYAATHIKHDKTYTSTLCDQAR